MMPIIKQSNLILHIPLDGQAVDRSDSPATCTVNGSGSFVDGKIGKCFQQRTVSGDYISCGSPTKLNIAFNAAMTISMLVKQNDSIGGSTTHWLVTRWNTPNYGWALRIEAGNAVTSNGLGFFIGTPTILQQILSTSNLIYPGFWYHVVMSKAANNTAAGVKFYINGVVVGLSQSSGDNQTGTISNYDFRIGAAVNNGGAAISIQHLMMWNTELTAQEIRFLYQSTKGAYLL